MPSSPFKFLVVSICKIHITEQNMGSREVNVSSAGGGRQNQLSAALFGSAAHFHDGLKLPSDPGGLKAKR